MHTLQTRWRLHCVMRSRVTWRRAIHQVQLADEELDDEATEAVRGYGGDDDETLQFVLTAAERGDVTALRTVYTSPVVAWVG